VGDSTVISDCVTLGTKAMGASGDSHVYSAVTLEIPSDVLANPLTVALSWCGATAGE